MILFQRQFQSFLATSTPVSFYIFYWFHHRFRFLCFPSKTFEKIISVLTELLSKVSKKRRGLLTCKLLHEMHSSQCDDYKNLLIPNFFVFCKTCVKIADKLLTRKFKVFSQITFQERIKYLFCHTVVTPTRNWRNSSAYKFILSVENMKHSLKVWVVSNYSIVGILSMSKTKS